MGLFYFKCACALMSVFEDLSAASSYKQIQGSLCMVYHSHIYYISKLLRPFGDSKGQ